MNLVETAALRDTVVEAIQVKLDACEAFTSACISHPVIEQHPEVRHRAVNEIIRDIWAQGNMMGSDDGIPTDYVRTSITVYPDGPGGASRAAFLYHPDNGFDPYSFQLTERVLVRNEEKKDSDPGRDVDMDTDLVDSGQVLINLASGAAVSKQCDIQAKNDTLNVPRFVIKGAGLKSGDAVLIDVVSNRTINVKKASTPGANGQAQTVDKEGRVRLHGARLAALCGSPTIKHGETFTALVVTPDGGEKYIQVGC